MRGVKASDLDSARQSLARAESMIASDDGLHHLQNGLALLERVIDGGADASSQAVARNVGRTYTEKIYQQIKRHLSNPHAPSEPELEHLFAIVRVFDDACIELPAESSALKIEIVTRLVEYYSEGYTPAQKQRLFEQLAEVAQGREHND